MAGPSTGRRLAAPLLLSVAVVAVAPFLRLLRDQLLEHFPRAFAPLMTAGFAITLLVAAVVAWRRIRSHRLLRFGGCLLAGVLIGLQVLGFARGSAEVSAVERIHILEYGLLALLFYWALRPSAGAMALLLAGVAAAAVGVVDETVQWLVATRVGELRDVLLNWAATATGLVAAVSLAPPASRAGPDPARTSRATGVLLAGWVLLCAFSFDLTQLGHRIEDREEGVVFLSWVDEERLRELAADRARRWATEPPGPLSPLALEDYFLTAGTAHVQARNRAMTRGRVMHAWNEQRILERWYAPVLEQRGLSSGQPLGLAPRTRAELRRQALATPQPQIYESHVLSARVFLHPRRGTLWAVTLVLAVGCLALTLPGRRSGARSPGAT